MIKLIRPLIKDEKGSMAVEFAICLPVLLTFVLTGSDLLNSYYNHNVMQASLNKFARLSETGKVSRADSIDNIKNELKDNLKVELTDINVTVTSYHNYADKKGEVIVRDLPPLNSNNGEDCFIDLNNNQKLDPKRDPRSDNDPNLLILYDVTVNKSGVFNKLVGKFGLDRGQMSLRAKVLVKNQPFNSNNNNAAEVSNYGTVYCPIRG